MHGLAGSAAAALLVTATGRSVSLGFAYLLVFGVGTELGVVVLTTALALPMGRALRRVHRAEPWLRVTSGALSVLVGALVVHEVGPRGSSRSRAAACGAAASADGERSLRANASVPRFQCHANISLSV